MSADQCDCSGGDLIHDPDCASWSTPAPRPAEFRMSRSAIRHPSHAATRRHFKNNPLPVQQSRRWTA